MNASIRQKPIIQSNDQQNSREKKINIQNISRLHQMLTQTSPRMVPVKESARSNRQLENQNKRQYKPAKSTLEE